MIYLTINSSPNPGHIATAWINNDELIQAGSTTGIMPVKQGFGQGTEVDRHAYLGKLKKSL